MALVGEVLGEPVAVEVSSVVLGGLCHPS
jgi:hypothetical protein